jgi:type I restriction enzyme S subunit
MLTTYTTYKDSGIEWIEGIPSHWDRLPLKQFGQVTLGKMLTSEDKGGYHLKPYMRSKNIQVERVDISDVKEMWFSDSELEKLKLKKGDLLFNEGGDVGRTCIWLKEIDECYIQNSVNRVRFENDDERYFLHLSTLYHSVGYYDSLVNRVSIPHLTKEKLESVLFLRPPLSEQQQIITFLDTKTSLIDSLIEKTQRKIELLKEKRTSLINEVVTKGLNPNVEMKDSGVEWIGKIPIHWEFLRLNNLGDFSKGKGITKDKIKESGNKCIRCGEIYTTYELRFDETNSFIDDETSSESILGFKGVLLFTGDGESLEEIGKCVVYEGEEELYIGGGINVFTPKQEKVIPIYLSYVMSSESIIFQKSRQGKGEIVVHIYSKQLKEIRLGLPPYSEQQQIVEYLDEQTQLIDKTISIEEKRIELLKEYRQSLISEVVTGKRKVV